MMKMKKYLILLLLVLLLMSCLPASAAQNRRLTLERAVMINDNQIVLEFSEPVAYALHAKYLPYSCIRMVTDTGGVGVVGQADTNDPNNIGKYLQWGGRLQFVDDKHDRVVWTFNNMGHLGCNSAADVMARTGLLGLEKFQKYHMVFCIEELPDEEPATDAKVINITTADGEVFLQPTRCQGWEAVLVPITINRGYAVNAEKFEDVGTGQSGFKVTYDAPVLALGNLEPLADTTEKINVETVVRNEPIMVAAILGGSLLVSTALIVVSVLLRKKKKAV